MSRSEVGLQRRANHCRLLIQAFAFRLPAVARRECEPEPVHRADVHERNDEVVLVQETRIAASLRDGAEDAVRVDPAHSGVEETAVNRWNARDGDRSIARRGTVICAMRIASTSTD